MKKFTNVIAILCLTIASSLCASAQYHSVIIHHSAMDAPTTVINLADNPVVRFNDLEMTVSTDKNQTVMTFPKEMIERFEHSTEAGIGDVTSDSNAPVFDGNTVSFTGLPAGSQVAVYDLAGRLCRSLSVKGDFTLDLSTLGSGTFVIKVNSLTFKIATK